MDLLRKGPLNHHRNILKVFFSILFLLDSLAIACPLSQKNYFPEYPPGTIHRYEIETSNFHGDPVSGTVKVEHSKKKVHHGMPAQRITIQFESFFDSEIWVSRVGPKVFAFTKRGWQKYLVQDASFQELLANPESGQYTQFQIRKIDQFEIGETVYEDCLLLAEIKEQEVHWGLIYANGVGLIYLKGQFNEKSFIMRMLKN